MTDVEPAACILQYRVTSHLHGGVDSEYVRKRKPSSQSVGEDMTSIFVKDRFRDYKVPPTFALINPAGKPYFSFFSFGSAKIDPFRDGP